MAKMIDLTEKLGLDEKPTIKIGASTLVVNNSARSMLQIMQLLDGNEVGPDEMFKAIDLIFDKNSVKQLDKLDLSVQDLMTVLTAAIDLIAGEDDEQGNALTPVTA